MINHWLKLMSIAEKTPMNGWFVYKIQIFDKKKHYYN